MLLCCCFILCFYWCRNCFNLLLSTGKRLHHTVQIWFNYLTVGETSKSSSFWSLHPQCWRCLFISQTTCSQSIHNNQELKQLWNYLMSWILTQNETRHPIYTAEIKFQSLTKETGLNVDISMLLKDIQYKINAGFSRKVFFPLSLPWKICPPRNIFPFQRITKQQLNKLCILYQ